ncbi:MAG: helix-turn-helix domain-containing protein [Cyanobacteria bacterium]|nr:helix-turn-helix domain-containing protein [Cyanobacteriota bacterium]
MTVTHALPPSALQPYANARLLLFSNALPGVLDSTRTGRFLFEGFLKRLRGISSKENAPGLDTGDFTYEGYLTRGALLPLSSSQPWDWLSSTISWSTSGIRPVSSSTPALLTPCFGAIWLGPLAELRSPGRLPSPGRGQLGAFSVTEFGGLYGAGGIGSLTQPLLGERIQAALKPNRIVVVASGESLNLLAERHLTTVTTLRGLNPTLTGRPSDPLPVGSWLFIPKRRAAANADTSTTSLPAGFYTPETLASYLGVSLSTIYSWNSSGYGPPFVKLGNLVRYTYEDVELWLARQLELSRG